jgi:hypothetical protein
VRLTTRRLTKTPPFSIVEDNAQKDLLRAEFARETRILEIKIEQLQNNKASQLAELGKKRDAINRLHTELSALRDRFATTEETVAVKAAAARVLAGAVGGNVRGEYEQLFVPTVAHDRVSELVLATAVACRALDPQHDELAD